MVVPGPEKLTIEVALGENEFNGEDASEPARERCQNIKLVHETRHR